MLLNGLLVAGLLNNSICVNDQRNPEKNAARMTRMKPRISKSTSPATIIITPTVIVAIIAMSFTDRVSRRKRKANARTKAKDDDLHIAAISVSSGMRAVSER